VQGHACSEFPRRQQIARTCRIFGHLLPKINSTVPKKFGVRALFGLNSGSDPVSSFTGMQVICDWQAQIHSMVASNHRVQANFIGIECRRVITPKSALTPN
jgi:hypothetical protein